MNNSAFLMTLLGNESQKEKSFSNPFHFLFHLLSYYIHDFLVISCCANVYLFNSMLV